MSGAWQDEPTIEVDPLSALPAVVTYHQLHYGLAGGTIIWAWHHGSSHFSDALLRVINAAATVISCGDNESHTYPRVDALGSFGKHGRGERPLIFSTELARSMREFTPIIKHFDMLRDYLRRIEDADDAKEHKRLQREMAEKQDRNVAVYGMITLRALDNHVVMVQKLEQPRDSGTKWDIHDFAQAPLVNAE
jgi:hypothetical protein